MLHSSKGDCRKESAIIWGGGNSLCGYVYHSNDVNAFLSSAQACSAFRGEHAWMLDHVYVSLCGWVYVCACASVNVWVCVCILCVFVRVYVFMCLVSVCMCVVILRDVLSSVLLAYIIVVVIIQYLSRTRFSSSYRALDFLVFCFITAALFPVSRAFM